MTVITGGDAVKLQGDELARTRVENARLSSEIARLRRELNQHKRLLWDRPETMSAKEIEDFKERRSVWAYLARRAMGLATCFRKSAGTLPKFESMTAMLRHSVSTAAEINLYNNPDIADSEKEALRQAYADQLRFIEAIDNLVEPKKRSVLEEFEKEGSRSSSHQIEAAVLVCYEELTAIVHDNGQQLIREGKIAPVQRHKVKLMSMSDAHRIIVGRLKGRTERAIENMARRARNRIAEVRAAVSEGRCPRADDNAIAGFFAYHQARSQLRRETGDALTRVRRLLSRFK
jgi:hypothetical protein